jgi:LysR family transcriptional regulator, nitrogen assimilation regulatory protein
MGSTYNFVWISLGKRCAAMDLRQLKYFLAIVDAGSFSKASQKLFVAQPSLSQQIANLEFELKTKLLLRSAQGITPTAAGSVLYRHARQILRQVDQIGADVRKDSSSEAGPVALGLPTTMAVILGAPLFDRVRKSFPGIRLQIVDSLSGHIDEMLSQGQLDLALLFRDAESRGMSVIPLFDEEFYLIGRFPREPREADCPLAMLANVPLVAPSPGSAWRPMIERTFQREGVELNIVAEIDSVPTSLAIANKGLASTILPAAALVRRAPDLHPVMRRIVAPTMSRPTSLCRSHVLPVSAAALALRKLIVALVGELHASEKWAGIALRPPPDPAALADTGGSCAAFERY